MKTKNTPLGNMFLSNFCGALLQSPHIHNEMVSQEYHKYSDRIRFRFKKRVSIGEICYLIERYFREHQFYTNLFIGDNHDIHGQIIPETQEITLSVDGIYEGDKKNNIFSLSVTPIVS